MPGVFPAGPLQGIRVLDFSWVLAGPFATRLLADFGAEVIKIQPLLPAADDAYSRAYYDFWNRNKLGLSLDVSQAEGRQIVRRLVRLSDAVVENFSPRVMGNWGLDYPELIKIKPDIILLSLSVMGHSGPWRDYSGFGPAVHAFSGLTGLTAYSDGQPVGPGLAYSDHIAGLYGALALQGALEYRERSGQGQFIDLSQTETLISLLAAPVIQNTLPEGSRISSQEVYEGVYPGRGEDRWVALTVASEAEWRAFKHTLGWSEGAIAWSEKQLHRDEIDAKIAEWTHVRSAEEAVTLLQAAGLAAAVVQNTADLAADRDLLGRGFFVHLNRGERGPVIGDASPIRLSETPAQYRRSAPLQGQDNDYVLRDLLGLSAGEIADLEQKGVIRTTPD
jgi:benzylsuccinate CoA-transferase BbsF subunit